MDRNLWVNDWLTAANSYDIDGYLKHWQEDAVLDDPSVGQAFEGHAGIREYFENYFIGYKTQTRLVKLLETGEDTVHLEVAFTGEFPGKKVKGTFDLTFEEDKIARAKADLI